MINDKELIVYIGYKTLRHLEEIKIYSNNGDIDAFKKSAKSYWDSDVEFYINIQTLIYLNEKIDGGFTPPVLSELNAIINSGHKYAVFSRSIKPGLSPGCFLVYLKEEEDEFHA